MTRMINITSSYEHLEWKVTLYFYDCDRNYDDEDMMTSFFRMSNKKGKLRKSAFLKDWLHLIFIKKELHVIKYKEYFFFWSLIFYYHILLYGEIQKLSS